jgi:N-acetylneuraminic acid mutarotase
MWWFDPSSGQYSSAGKLPYPVADAGVLPSVDGVYLLGGESPAFTNRVIRVHLS